MKSQEISKEISKEISEEIQGKISKQSEIKDKRLLSGDRRLRNKDFIRRNFSKLQKIPKSVKKRRKYSKIYGKVQKSGKFPLRKNRRMIEYGGRRQIKINKKFKIQEEKTV